MRALHGVSLEVRQGETVALLGTNGNGKSTLMKCIMGLLKPSRGTIVLETDGERVELTGRMPHEIVALGVVMVPEGRRLFPKLSVRENLLLGAFRRAARGEIEQNLALCHEAFPVLQERSSQLAGSLSGGQQQMLAIARAIMSAPRLLLVDEPSVGLSPVLVKQMIDTIAALKQRFGLTVLMAEQNFHQASRIADRGYIIVHGEIAFEGRNLHELQGSELVKSYYFRGSSDQVPHARPRRFGSRARRRGRSVAGLHKEEPTQTSARIARSLERVECHWVVPGCGACGVTLLAGASAASAERRLAVIHTWRNARRGT